MSDRPPPPPPPPGEGSTPPQGYGQPPPPGYGYPAQVGSASPSPSPLAIGSLVTAIFGLLCCSGFFVLSIAAVVMAVFARKEISESGGLKTGDGLAIAGLVIGGLGILLGVVTWGLRFTGAINYGFSPF